MCKEQADLMPYMDIANKQHRLYWMPILESIDCLHESTEYHKNEFIKRMVLDQKKFKDRKIFRIESKLEKIVVVSFEIVESILRRNCMGIKISPVESL